MSEAAATGSFWVLLAGFLLGYLAGSVPFGFLVTRAAGAGDIRTIGSGNIGATNVLRTGRKGLALATLLADILKGAVPVWLAHVLLGPQAALLAGGGAIGGHCFPVWLGFKGGKGVATAAGIILALTPLAVPILVILFVVVVWRTRFVSLGSMLAAAAAPCVALLFGEPATALVYALMAVLVVAKHRGNIARLRQGSENRLSFSKGA